MYSRYLIPCLLFAAIAFRSSAQSTEIKSLTQKLAAATSDSVRYDVLIDLHNATFKTDPAQSRQYAEQILALYRHTDDWRRICKAYMALARCERKKRNYPAIFAFDAKALEYANRSKSALLRFTTNKTFANDYTDAGQYSKALPYLREAEQVALQEAAPAYLGDVYYAYGAMYRQQAQNKKSLPYFRKAIDVFRQTGNNMQRAKAQLFMVEAMIALGIRDSTDRLIEEAMDIYRKEGSVYSLASTYSRLGQIFLQMGDRERGLQYYGKAREGFQLHHNDVDYALAGLDMAAEWLQQNKMSRAKALLEESEAILRTTAYAPGNVQAKMLRGAYYSQSGNRPLATRMFEEAMMLSAAPDAKELRIELQRLYAAHFMRYKEYRAADTLVYRNAADIIQVHDPEQTAAEIAFLKARSRLLDSTGRALLSLLYKAGGPQKVQALLDGRSLTEMLDGHQAAQVLVGAPAADASSDSEREAEYHQRFLAMEARFRTRIMRDSIKATVAQMETVKRQRELSNQLLAAVCIICILLTGGFALQRRYRRRAEHHQRAAELHRRQAEQDAAEISGLSKRVRHLTDNNLSMIHSYVDDAMAGGNMHDSSIAQSLKNRIAAVILLNKRMYTDDPAEKVALQGYLADLAGMSKNIFDPEGRIALSVSAPQTVSRDTAARLGIITAELLTNSYKYAFRGKGEGHIRLEIATLAGGKLHMHYQDSGPGLPEVIAPGEGMGHIIGDAHSLRGEHRFYNEDGLHFTLGFYPFTPEETAI